MTTQIKIEGYVFEQGSEGDWVCGALSASIAREMADELADKGYEISVADNAEDTDADGNRVPMEAREYYVYCTYPKRDTGHALSTYARQTAADMGEDRAAAIRAMLDEPGEVARDLGIDAQTVIDWCDAEVV